MNSIITNCSCACPHCGKRVAIRWQRRIYERDVYTNNESLVADCDTEAGGCGKDFVVHLQETVKTAVRRIEGAPPGPFGDWAQ